MKKAIAFSMAAIMLLSMAGCSKDSKKTKSDESAETKTNKESVSGESDGDSKNATGSLMNVNFTMDFGVVYDKGGITISSCGVEYQDDENSFDKKGHYMLFDVKNDNDFTAEVDFYDVSVNNMEISQEPSVIVSAGETERIKVYLEAPFFENFSDYSCEDMGIFEAGIVLMNYDEFSFIDEDGVNESPDIVIKTSLYENYKEFSYEGVIVFENDGIRIVNFMPYFVEDMGNTYFVCVMENANDYPVLISGCGNTNNGEEDDSFFMNGLVYAGHKRACLIQCLDRELESYGEVVTKIRVERFDGNMEIYDFTLYTPDMFE